ncbi:MAG: YeeE/YedE family protein [Gammaproteobacteria bacterium]
MSFESFAGAQSFFLWSTFFVAIILGAIVNKTNFCTMGAVSDLVNMGDSGRMRAWILAATTAMLGVVLLEALGVFSLGTGTLPPYRGAELQWGRYILGGLLFGVGMTLASGCGNKTLIRIGGGNIKSIMVLLIIGIIAYYMVDPYKQVLPANWYARFFAPWLGEASVSLSTPQDLGSIVAGWFGTAALTTRTVIGLVLGAIVLFLVFRSADFRRSFDNVFAGLAVGLAIVLVWYFTATTSISTDDSQQSLTQFYANWDFVMDSSEGKPQNGSTNLQPQSYTFISPMGQTWGYMTSGMTASYLSFGVMAVAGIILGSLLWSLLSRSFRVEWFASFKDFYTHVIGAVLMGFGGVLGLGCTIGQGVTGVSTLALGSFMTFGSIVLGSALTMKIQYYKLVYEEEATFMKAFVTALVDMKLLPAGMRKLEAV